MKKPKKIHPKKAEICGMLVASLEDSFPEITPEIAAEIYDAFVAGQRYPDLPYGELGRFVGAQLAEADTVLGGLPA
jgi:hypothetical protein